MKNQYFGDVNDYRKYGLLRCLVEASNLRLGVCWLLTKNDNRSDGEFRRYLNEPQRWSKYDPSLFSQLQILKLPAVTRDVRRAEEWQILPKAKFFNDILGDDVSSRSPYFRDAFTELSDCPLIFFDPDNGVEVASTRRGARGSSKYLYWSEIHEAYRRGHSLVIYQHFPRAARAAFTSTLAADAAVKLRAPLVDSFATAHVLFLLIARPEHVNAFDRAHELIEKRWSGQISPMSHVAHHT